MTLQTLLDAATARHKAQALERRAREHAASLTARYGPRKAAEIAAEKITDAPFLVNGNQAFWARVQDAIANPTAR